MPFVKGQVNPKGRKVTPENYPIIKSVIESGIPYTEIEKAFKVSGATLWSINKFDTFEEYRANLLEQTERARKRREEKRAAETSETAEAVKELEKTSEEKHPAFMPNFTEANQERIIELLEQILAKLDCAEMAVVSDDEPKRRGLFSFGSKSPF